MIASKEFNREGSIEGVEQIVAELLLHKGQAWHFSEWGGNRGSYAKPRKFLV